MSQKFVLVKNLTEGPTMFTDHVSMIQTLTALGTPSDTVKILIEEDRYEQVAQWYNTLKSNENLHVQFSDESMDSMKVRSKLSINPGPAVDERRARGLRATVDAGMRRSRMAQARYIREKARNILEQKAATPVTVTEKASAIPSQDTIKPELDAAIAEVVRQPKSVEGPGDGVDASFEALNARPMDELKVYASQLGVEVPGGISKKGLVKLVLDAVQPKVEK